MPLAKIEKDVFDFICLNNDIGRCSEESQLAIFEINKVS